MKMVMQDIFDRIIEHYLSKGGAQIPELSYNRWIAGGTDEVNWLKYLSFINEIELEPSKYFAVFRYDGNHYMVTIGYEEALELPEFLSVFEMNSGIFSAVINHFKLNVLPSFSAEYLDNYILNLYEGVDYRGHNYSNLEKIFSKIVLYKIALTTSIPVDSIERLVGIFLTKNAPFVKLPYSANTLGTFEEAFYNLNDVFPYDNLLQALISIQFKFAFIDVYRCLEMLFQIVYAEEAYRDLSITTSFNAFLTVVDNKLKWKPTERSSVEKIINTTEPHFKQQLQRVCDSHTGNETNLASWIYDLRCSIVHLKTNHTSFTLKHNEWDSLISELIFLLEVWYPKYTSLLL